MSNEIVKGEPFALAWSVPKDQRLSYKITPSSAGPFNAKSIGEQLAAVAKLLTSTSNEDSDLKWMVGITAAFTYADGSIQFDLVIMPKKSKLPPRTSPADTQDEAKVISTGK